MMDQRATFIAWLNDAHALEQNLIQALQNQIGMLDDYPEMRSQIEAHLEETREHEQLMRQCIELAGGTVSATKNAMGIASGYLSSMTASMAGDAMVKNMIANLTMENFEIGSYIALIQAAEALQEPAIADICRQILEDEYEMADWLEERLPGVTMDHLSAIAAANA